MIDSVIQERKEAASAALAAFAEKVGNFEPGFLQSSDSIDVIVDLIADLLHLAESQQQDITEGGFDAPAIVNQALRHYENETV